MIVNRFIFLLWILYLPLGVYLSVTTKVTYPVLNMFGYTFGFSSLLSNWEYKLCLITLAAITIYNHKYNINKAKKINKDQSQSKDVQLTLNSSQLVSK